ncbi:MAG: DUF177 domain-containing protein [Ilumatobacteraceae bacterium]|jgi:uncharacterized protein|nr:DUF177 domain-containing protein [Ilumatobacteraceae bacterium]MDP4702761.1 DUF177 domain-containing protein [Ilumatobacteraceae bacterium]MDP5108505.1 DUF177 domain-containing protein [Ilumatobacteraceae bacterium]
MSSSARHPSPLTGLLVNAAELLRRPGNWKDVEIDVESKHFEFEDSRLLPQLVGIHLHLECSNNGIVVSGNVNAQWHDQCCRCLKDISGVAVGEVAEIYQREITDPDAYRLESDQLNLAPMVREHVLLALPDTPVCRPDCPGLCPVCGADKSTPEGAACGCSETPVDPRWDALRDLGSQFPE